MRRFRRSTLRRALFNAHLVLALALGVYIVVISVSGSAVVFRGEITRWAVPQSVPSTDGERLTGDALRAALERAYPDDTVVRFTESRRPSRPVSVLLERDGIEHGRLFDPFASADMGESYPPAVRIVEWLVALHDDLLAGDTGRKINGIAGAFVLLIVVTGAAIWWPGRGRFAQSLYVTRKSPRFVRQLHGAVGFFSLLLLANWALTGVYMAFPAPFERLIDALDPDPTDFERPGEGVVRMLTTAHFGRFGGLPIRIAWTALGLVPVLLVVTGVLLWYRRVVRPRLRSPRSAAAERRAGDEPPPVVG